MSPRWAATRSKNLLGLTLTPTPTPNIFYVCLPFRMMSFPLIWLVKILIVRVRVRVRANKFFDLLRWHFPQTCDLPGICSCRHRGPSNQVHWWQCLANGRPGNLQHHHSGCVHQGMTSTGPCRRYLTLKDRNPLGQGWSMDGLLHHRLAVSVWDRWIFFCVCVRAQVQRRHFFKTF